MSITLKLGTRKSDLAVAQSESVKRTLEELHSGVEVELVTFTTKGDTTPGMLAPLGGKGLFTQELESGLLDGSLDLAVHSLKDLPVDEQEDLAVVAYPERADARDVMISELADDLEGLPEGSLLLTGALRRQSQILALNPSLEVEGVRGNVQTRLRKWRDRNAGGVILAAAGLDRLNMDDLPAHRLDPEVFVPAPGQGTLAIQVRSGSDAEELCRPLNHEPTARIADAERRIVAAFGGNCALPLAAWARPDGDDGMALSALLALPDGSRVARADATAGTPEEVAAKVVDAMRDRGADEILEEIGPNPALK